jgi:hypothetical protein
VGKEVISKINGEEIKVNLDKVDMDKVDMVKVDMDKVDMGKVVMGKEDKARVIIIIIINNNMVAFELIKYIFMRGLFFNVSKKYNCYNCILSKQIETHIINIFP